MTSTALILNVVLAAFVVIGIVGGLAWSIVMQERDGTTGRVLGARRGRPAHARASTRARIIGRPVQNRA